MPLIRPPAAWAIQHNDDLGIGIRVALPEFFQRGPDPDDVVTALRDHGVPVTLRYNRDRTPWKTGRIVGLSTDYGDLPQHLFEELSEAMAPGGRETIDVDLTEIGIKHHRDGGVTVFPERFTGRVEIVVAVAPWQAEPDPQTWPWLVPEEPDHHAATANPRQPRHGLTPPQLNSNVCLRERLSPC